MKPKLLFCLTLIAAAQTGLAQGTVPSSAWNGTWKLNQAKSKLTGDTFTLAALPNGGFHLSTPSHSLDRDYPCDGTDYPVIADRTGTCKKIDDRHYEMAGKVAGKPEWHGTSVVSEDGRYLTNTAYEHRPDGTDDTNVNTYERVGKGTGRAGTWRSVKSTESVPDSMTIRVTGDTMRTESPAYKMVTTAKREGSAAKFEGPMAPAGMTMNFKADSPTKLHYAQILNGKPAWEGTETLSADGKTLVQEEWETGSPAEKQKYVYEKQ